MSRPRPFPILLALSTAAAVGLCSCVPSAETAESREVDDSTTISGVATTESETSDQSGFRAVLVGEGTVSTEVGEAFPAVDPGGDALYFSVVVDGNWPHQYLVVARRTADGWSRPEPLPFSNDRQYSDRAPRLSPDGLRMVFTSNRPMPGRSHDPRDFNLWVVDRSAPGATWSGVRPLSEAVNTTSSEIHASIGRDGALYFASARPGGQGRSDVYRAERSGSGYAPAVNLGSPINSEQSQPDLLVTPEGSMMILVITDHATGLGGDDLYVSYRRDNAWTTPSNLGPAVNTPEYEYGPTLSPDGQLLYFTSHRSGDGDTYRIPLAELDLER